jgi:hypothetical protein
MYAAENCKSNVKKAAFPSRLAVKYDGFAGVSK